MAAPICTLRRALSARGFGPTEVAALCAVVDGLLARHAAGEPVESFRHLLLDARVIRLDGNADGALAVVLVLHVDENAPSTVLAADVGPSQDRAYWLGFLGPLLSRGLGDLPLVARGTDWPLAALLGARPPARGSP
ncbi:MAG TPA: transposase [Chloroflexota bacterium]|jgi:transposase-like protein